MQSRLQPLMPMLDEARHARIITRMATSNEDVTEQTPRLVHPLCRRYHAWTLTLQDLRPDTATSHGSRVGCCFVSAKASCGGISDQKEEKTSLVFVSSWPAVKVTPHQCYWAEGESANVRSAQGHDPIYRRDYRPYQTDSHFIGLPGRS